MSDHDEWISYSHWGMFTLGRKSSTNALRDTCTADLYREGCAWSAEVPRGGSKRSSSTSVMLLEQRERLTISNARAIRAAYAN